MGSTTALKLSFEINASIFPRLHAHLSARSDGRVRCEQVRRLAESRLEALALDPHLPSNLESQGPGQAPEAQAEGRPLNLLLRFIVTADSHPKLYSALTPLEDNRRRSAVIRRLAEAQLIANANPTDRTQRTHSPLVAPEPTLSPEPVAEAGSILVPDASTYEGLEEFF